MEILIIGQDKDDVGSSGVGWWSILRYLAECYLHVGGLSMGWLGEGKGGAEEEAPRKA